MGQGEQKVLDTCSLLCLKLFIPLGPFWLQNSRAHSVGRGP